MERVQVPKVRPDWKEQVVRDGMLWADTEDGPYWFEAMQQPVYYKFREVEIDSLMKGGEVIHQAILEVLTNLLSEGVEKEYAEKWRKAFGLSEKLWDLVKYSFNISDEWEFFGRFDFLMTSHGPKVLEYNADTPTTLIESAVCQWNWFQDMGFEKGSQFNNIHEGLVNRWKELNELNNLRGSVNFVSVNLIDDVATLCYIAETCREAGLEVRVFPVEDIQFDEDKKVFLDNEGNVLENCFKLYPWEWMIHEKFSEHLSTAPTRWIEPEWKLLVSNKAILALLWDYYGDTSHPVVKYLMPTYMEGDFGDWDGSWVSKPTLSREGSDVKIIKIHQGQEEVLYFHTGMYSEESRVYQKFIQSLTFEGCVPMLGVWMAGPEAVGLGIREDDSLITKNNSRFIPHVWE